MKEMIYSFIREVKVLYKGTYKNNKFSIVSLGTHPTAYVECKFDNCTSYYDRRLLDVKVHGDFTYLGEAYWDKEDETTYFGWDYLNPGDYLELLPSTVFAKRWTTKEIYDEVKSVIEQLKERENLDNE